MQIILIANYFPSTGTSLQTKCKVSLEEILQVNIIRCVCYQQYCRPCPI